MRSDVLRAGAARTRRAGFTLLEILIALVVLAVALLGVLSLLVASTRLAADVVEDAFAATTARSVYEAARIGARERAFSVQEGGAVVRGFVITERGVSDTVPAPGGGPPPVPTAPPPLPENPRDSGRLTALRASDQVVFLPGPPGPGASEAIFVFPRPQGAATGNAAPGHDDSLSPAVKNDQGVDVTLDVRRVYPLAAPVAGVPTGEPMVSTEMSDQYGWALLVRRALGPVVANPANPSQALDWPAKTFLPDAVLRQDGLYEVQVLVFRNFDADPARRNNQPVSGGRFGGLIAVGP